MSKSYSPDIATVYFSHWLSILVRKEGMWDGLKITTNTHIRSTVPIHFETPHRFHIYNGDIRCQARFTWTLKLCISKIFYCPENSYHCCHNLHKRSFLQVHHSYSFRPNICRNYTEDRALPLSESNITSSVYK